MDTSLKSKVCAFYLNSGRCYKVVNFEDKHIMAWEGAVTAYQEEVIDTRDARSVHNCDGEVTWVLSSSEFYITSPQGTRDISSLQ